MKEKIESMKLIDTKEVDPTAEEIEKAQEAFEVTAKNG